MCQEALGGIIQSRRLFIKHSTIDPSGKTIAVHMIVMALSLFAVR